MSEVPGATQDEVTAPVVSADQLAERLDAAIAALEQASAFAKASPALRVADVAHRLMSHPEGPELIYRRIQRMQDGGVFAGTDWDHPETLQPRLASGTLEHGSAETASLEMLSELRLLAVARGEAFHLAVSSESATHFLAQLLAFELDHLFGPRSEADRAAGSHGDAVRNHLSFVADGIGYDHVLDSLVAEIERILAQRPIAVDHVKVMIGRIAANLDDPDLSGTGSTLGLNRLVSALFGPTANCREDPGVETYAERLTSLDESALWQEAREFALAMHSTGLVSPYQEVFVHHVNGTRDDLLGQVLGLSRTGMEALSCYAPLVRRLIEVAITPGTTQTIYSLAQMIERAVLFDPAVAPSLWAMIGLVPSPSAELALAGITGEETASTVLLAGVIDVLGQPLGIGQGNNPTCQAARAISMWSLAAPSYVLRLVTRAARDDEIRLFFEGDAISSAEVPAGTFTAPLVDVDPVSMVLVPHLDRIYIEMGRRCASRSGDPHAWINREMHGWWVGRETALAVDLASGHLDDYPSFVRRFYALYHPLHNRDRPVIHPQPAGIAVTDGLGRFIGWHAISILRVGMDPSEEMRVYFFNPNNDGGQDWGQGVVVSTEGCGERFGESSLPIAAFTSRLYLYHYDPPDVGEVAAVPAEVADEVEALARASWAADR
ncbi:hypothetical protein [Rhabdothermincola salaria]|uniref:hypothetical protein n=1 Tax=Rhabdothermincola salaria TaxID=2903142 RepID=UPI001E2B526D|nr:hypothetical protein [Rhabdothermincola salaria]MCD9622837.1 hypothetical protein [Rhabdothermincola salaria]